MEYKTKLARMGFRDRDIEQLAHVSLRDPVVRGFLTIIGNNPPEETPRAVAMMVFALIDRWDNLKPIARRNIELSQPPVLLVQPIDKQFERKTICSTVNQVPHRPIGDIPLRVLDWVLEEQIAGRRPTDADVAKHFNISVEMAVEIHAELERAGEFG